MICHHVTAARFAITANILAANCDLFQPSLPSHCHCSPTTETFNVSLYVHSSQSHTISNASSCQRSPPGVCLSGGKRILRTYTLNPPKHHFLTLECHQAFGEILEHYENRLQSTKYWGAGKASEVMVDNGSPVMPSKPLLRGSDGRLAHSVSRGIIEYTAAIKLYDKLVYLVGHKHLQDGVLQHERMPFWIGDNIVSHSSLFFSKSGSSRMKVLDQLSDLKELLSSVSKEAAGLSRQLNTPPHPSSDPTIRLAHEVASAGSVRRCGTIVRNLAVMAFTISLYMKVVSSRIFRKLETDDT